MLSEYQEQLIEKYFRRALSTEEQVVFDLELNSQQEFRDAVEAQRLILQGLEMNVISVQVGQYMGELHKEEAHRIGVRRLRVMGIAASVLVLMMAVSYAAFRLGWLDTFFRKETEPRRPEQEVPVDSLQVKEDTIAYLPQYPVQQVVFHAGDDNNVKGGLGTFFSFPAASLLNAEDRAILDSVRTDLIEILNPEHMVSLLENSELSGREVIKIFYIHPHYKGTPVQMNALQPPVLFLNPDVNARLYYGGRDIQQVSWQKAGNDAPTLITAPTPVMIAYKQFLEGRIFLDSLQQFYVLSDGFFRPASGKGREYTVSYVRGVETMVNAYVNDRYARENVLEARRLWEIYQAQHKVEVYRGGPNEDIALTELTLYHPGWYAVVID